MKKTLKRKYLVIVCLLIVALATTIVLAETTTHTYSACLSRGILYNVAIDANPPAPCKLGDLITWNQQGPAGAQGPAGPAGVQGPAGVSGYEIIQTRVSDRTTPGSAWIDGSATCPVGKSVIGGGFTISSFILPSNFVTVSNYPFNENTWYTVINDPDQNINVMYVYAICANTG